MIPVNSSIAGLLISGSILVGETIGSCAYQAERGEKETFRPVRTDSLGDPLPTGASARIGSIRGWIGEASSRIVFSPDGRFVTATSEQVKMPLRLWEPKTGRLIRRLHQLDPLSYVQHVAFSLDSALIAAADQIGAVRVGSTEAGRKLCVLLGPEGVNAIVFSPDAKRVHALDGNNAVLWTWDIATRKTARCLSLETDAIAFAPDGRYIAIAQRGGTMSIRDLTSWKELHRFGTHGRPTRPLAFSPDGKRLASMAKGPSVKVWDVATGRLEGRYPGLRTPDGLIIENLEDQVAFSPDGKSLAVAETLSTLSIWDVDTGGRLRRFYRIEPEHGFSFAPDGKTLVSGGRYLRTWDIVRGLEIHRERAMGIADSLAFHPDGKAIATANGDKLHVWEIRSGNELVRMAGQSNSIRSVAYSPDGKTLAASGADGFLRLWDAQNGREKHRIVGLSGFVPQVAFSPDGKMVAAVDDRGVGLWNVATAAEVPRFSKLTKTDFRQLCFSADGKTLALTGKVGIFVCDVETGRVLKSTSRSPFALALSRDGTTLAWETDSGGLCLWKWKDDTFTFIDIPPGRARDDDQIQFPAIAFSPDGKTLASTGQKNSITLRDAATGTGRKILAGHEAIVTSLDFSRDGQSLASGSVDGTVLIWDVEN